MEYFILHYVYRSSTVRFIIWKVESYYTIRAWIYVFLPLSQKEFTSAHLGSENNKKKKRLNFLVSVYSVFNFLRVLTTPSTRRAWTKADYVRALYSFQSEVSSFSAEDVPENLSRTVNTNADRGISRCRLTVFFTQWKMIASINEKYTG